MKDKNLQELSDYVVGLFKEYLPKLALGIVLLLIGLWIIRRLTRLAVKVMEKKNVDISLRGFLKGLINIGLKVLLVLSILSTVGIETTSFIAVVGAASLAIGLALQGSLSNFAGGVLILLFKPFKVGDLIESDGVIGQVQTITVLNTHLITPDDNTAILPNGIVANTKVINFTKENHRRIDLEVGIAYDADPEKAKEAITAEFKKVDRVLQNPAPFIGILNFADSSVNMAVRPYCKSSEYWEAYFDANAAIKRALDGANIEIPFPQQVVRKEE